MPVFCRMIIVKFHVSPSICSGSNLIVIDEILAYLFVRNNSLFINFPVEKHYSRPPNPLAVRSFQASYTGIGCITIPAPPPYG